MAAAGDDLNGTSIELVCTFVQFGGWGGGGGGVEIEVWMN